MVNLLVVSMATTDNMFVWGKYICKVFSYIALGDIAERKPHVISMK